MEKKSRFSCNTPTPPPAAEIAGKDLEGALPSHKPNNANGLKNKNGNRAPRNKGGIISDFVVEKKIKEEQSLGIRRLEFTAEQFEISRGVTPGGGQQNSSAPHRFEKC